MASHKALLAAFCVAAAISLCQYAAADKMTWAPCDEGQTAFTPSSVTLSPDPPVIGSAATFVISGNIESELQGGSVDMVVSFFGFPIYSSTSDLCSKTTCPVPAGPISLTLEELLPPIAPPGDYGLQVVARGPGGDELACVNVNFSLVLPPFTAASTTAISTTASLVAATSSAASRASLAKEAAAAWALRGASRHHVSSGLKVKALIGDAIAREEEVKVKVTATTSTNGGGDGEEYERPILR
ncbi:hypothetical protein VOLCADRAFT_77249 [Volvox carteri f. nagariensis]|uniref:MD-2-related lipid-recognition domain-containing protein n=1 Tax=Volvox carteri f. nagariensis TaxID=3068 RepID=D8UDR3_VOLCA|nr:uncharacterized protein VOLCADRAFT_77249 [Volvox carteri f. nagariensis]EFJ42088.1 hypothetical protein VOLCADRAFT_77249 [Volvox carteri f. nagariensis]|eukprot:XP_002956785.1 hypothetical protein VOLCADRAFT_77249 [Volvox carteri f. nagariensis]